MKKLLCYLFCIVIVISLFSVTIEASALGWQKSAQDVKINTTFSDELSVSDYRENVSGFGSYYYDAFRFDVPEKGTITLRTECAKDILDYCSVDLYSSADIDEPLWFAKPGTSKSSGYSSARGIDYYEWEIALNKGTYYLTVGGYNTFLNVTIDYTLTFTKAKAPQPVKPKETKSGNDNKTIRSVSSQPMQVQAITKTVKAKKVKRGKVKVKKGIKVYYAKGTVTFKKLSGSKKLTISKNGVITVRKGRYKKGKILKIKVRVTASGNADYYSGYKIVTVKIKIK